MSNHIAFLFGLLFITAHVPWWGQPAMEPKSALLLAAGGMSWAWIAFKKIPAARFPWAFILPMGWLALSAAWSPSPASGLQRFLWVLSACGVGTLVSATSSRSRLFEGMLTGTAVHALIIFLQWIPPVRAWLPPSLGIDSYQGIGRGLFHNPNMAALPLLFCVGWILLDRQFWSPRWLWHLVWLLPALSLTQSRWSAGVGSALVAFSIMRNEFGTDSSAKGILRLAPLALLSLALGFTAHRFGWMLPAVGLLLGLSSTGPRPLRTTNTFRWATCLALLGAVVLGHLALTPKNQPSSLYQLPSSEAPNVSAGEVSLSQRMNYYRAAGLALLDSPIWGHGLGSARAVYPNYVDKTQPAIATAYGDFQRPNNLHSEPVELLLEGGLALIVLLVGGLWIDRRNATKVSQLALLAPLGLLALLDFPFHYPPGLLILGICLTPDPSETESSHPPIFRLATLSLGIALILLSLGQIRAAHAQPRLEKRFLAHDSPLDTEADLKQIWKTYPFPNDLFDLLSKTGIQAASAHPCQEHAEALDDLLRRDPFDHHLLLARAQLATKLGDPTTASQRLAVYARVAPRDPARYLRLAEDAIRSGKPQTAALLLGEATRQPGFTPKHQQRVELLKSAIDQAASAP